MFALRIAAVPQHVINWHGAVSRGWGYCRFTTCLERRELRGKSFAASSMVRTRSGAGQGEAGSYVAAAGVSSAATSRSSPGVAESPRFQQVTNFRDLAEALPSLRPGLVFRAAAPVNATEQDIATLYKDLAIKELVDLRSSEEIAKGGHCPAFQGLSFCKFRRDSATRRSIADPRVTRMADSDIMRVQISPLEKETYYVALLGRMPLSTALYVAGLRLFNKQAATISAIQFVNQGGLELLYEILLDMSAPEFVAALRRISWAAEQDRPILFFCKAGKDRTGLLAVMLLHVCGASTEQVLQDYMRSDEFHQVALAGLEGDPRVTGLDRQKFERAPREAMEHALSYVAAKHGNVSNYLAAAGFTLEEQQHLRGLLTGDSGAAAAAGQARVSKL